MKRSVAKQTPNAAMAAKLLTKGKAKCVAIRVDAAMMAAAMMTAAMMAAAMIATVIVAAAMMAVATIPAATTSTAMTVPLTATGVTTNKVAPIIKGVASAMIATMTGRAVATARLTMSMTGILLHEAPLARAHLEAPGVLPKTPTDPSTLTDLMALTILI